MKKIILLSAVLFFAGMIILSFKTPEYSDQTTDDLKLDIPESVLTVLENSCFDCHTAEASSTKAKSKLNFSKWNEYKTSKKINKLEGIHKTVKNGKMPTKKYLEKFPEKKLSQDQVILVSDWARDTSERLIGE